MVFAKRREQLRKQMQERLMDVVVIDSPENLYYFTGFTGGEAFFVCFREEENGYVITDSRYYEQVEKECPKLTLVKLEKTGYSGAVRKLLSEKDCPEADIYIEDSMTTGQYMRLTDACPEAAFHTAGDTINACRMVKDREELGRIARAEEIGDEAFTHILDVIKPGITEAEIALELEYTMKKHGASGLSFDTIVASGTNASMPHAQVTDRRVQAGDFITMDFGCIYQGYCSDMTRTVAVGTVSDEMKKVYQIVLDANCKAMEAIHEGVTCCDVDAIARDHIRDNGYGDYFGHGLGHGVGIAIHEEPRFSPKCKVTALENMVITVEPGIYLPGQFGVRIEDLIVVKKDGYEKLSHSEKRLITVG